MKRRFLPGFLCLCLIAGLASGCSPVSIGTDSGLSGSAERTATAVISFSADGAVLEGAGAEIADDGDVEIVAGGVYRVTGVSDKGRIVVEAAETDEVTLVLDGCELTCPDDEVIYFKTVGSAAVVLADGTENSLTSGAPPIAAEEPAADTEEAEEDVSGAALRAKAPLTVSGAGSLRVYGYINNGIAATGDLTVSGGEIAVTSVNDALKSRGTLLIADGAVTIDSQADAVQADGDIRVVGGRLDIITGGGAAAGNMKVSDSSMFGNGGPFGDGGPGRDSRDKASDEASDEADETEEAVPEESGAAAPESASGEAVPEDAGDASAEVTEERSDNGPFGGGMPWDRDDESSVSQKGLKAGGSILVSGGTIVIDAADDAFHADVAVEISGGDITAASADDGVHADVSVNVTGGSLVVTYCYEGVEATTVTVTDGYVDVTSTDDGFNVNGGDFGFPGFGSREPEEETEEDTEKVTPVLRISGGTVIIDSGGDGLDSNGSLFIEGGVIRVSGPSTNWDAALDTGDGGDYTLLITGGELIAGGYSGMMEAPDLEDASQPSIYYRRSDGYCADGDPVKLLDKDGKEILSGNLAHSFNCVVLSSPQIEVGQTYTLVMGDQEYEIVMESTNYSNRGGRGGGSREARENDSGAAGEDPSAE